MNKQEELYFQALFQDRAESADMLEKPSMRGIKNSVVEKYSDQAHFIYELLQNADDARATNARFILEPNRLIFAHNGTRHFSVSNPADEDRDSQEGTLGDINSITSIANSNKTEASIGKFGVGFKAVFQYTSTPHIYDPEFRFRIDRFIVPSLLKEDFPGRRPEETLFVFPFDHTERDEIEAYNDISDKLQNLSFPLLFMSRIKSIEFEFKDVLGLYGKNINETRQIDDTVAEQICLTQNNGDEFYDENLWLFSRTDECDRRYSVGYFLDKEGHLSPINEPAFCFFPTKEVTGLNFMIHAPFLLTDSREGIRAGVPHNDRMLQKLAVLSADALVYLRNIGEERQFKLIDDDIINIIPIDSEQFSDPANKRKVSFLPFFKEIRDKFKNDRLLPASDGYVGKNNAYWASVPQLPQLFSNEQLSDIVENDAAKWVFTSLARDEVQRNSKALFAYLDDLVRTNINEDIIISGRNRDFYYNRVLGIRQSLENIKGITAEFIEKQTFEWLHSFYKWLSETKHRTEVATDKPIFLDQNGKAAAAFDKGEHAVLFLPVSDVTGYRVVHPELLKNPDTKAFTQQIGIKQPSLKDQIYTIILPMYRKGGEIDTDPHFMLFFKYYCKCSNEEVDEFIDLIKEYEFLTYYNKGETQPYRGAAGSMYMPTSDLMHYFVFKDEVRFVALDEYKTLVGPAKEKQLISFLTELGVQTRPRIIKEESNGYYHKESESFIDGLLEFIYSVEQEKNFDASVFIWKQLCSFVEDNRLSWRVLRKEVSTRPDGRYRFRTEYEASETARALKTKKWLVNIDGSFDAPENISLGRLSSEYSLELDGAETLLQYLSIPDDPVDDSDEEDDTNLTDSQKEKIEFANKMRAMGFDEDDLEDYKEFKRLKEARKHAEELQGAGVIEQDHTDRNGEDESGQSESDDIDDDDFMSELDDDEESPDAGTSTSGKEKKKLDKTTSRVVKDIVQRTKGKTSRKAPSEQSASDDDLDVDQDEYTPAPIDYSKRIEKAKQKSAAEIEKIAYFEELQAKVMEAPKYSYGWFKTLLELESINSGEANANSKEVSISFARVEREPGTKRTLILRHPDRYIPQFMEDLADIPLVLHMGGQKKTVAIEVANIKSYTLRVKMKNSDDIANIDLSSVTSATIDAKSPAFLIEELRKQFNELGKDKGFEDDYDMQGNLCENIEFVFGPPGTGKTTHLAKNVLIPMMQNNADCKVLVLTPTNKSADVLVSRIMEVSKDKSYNKWLVRFGTTGDEKIEQSPVFRDKTFDIRTLRRNVTVTTIARFPYDFFMPQGARIFLHGLNWDYIVIDEASMIPIVNIVFPLYKKTPRKFIIAGDPFQIEPITSVDLWKNENIYTMVQLRSFTNPKTVPYQYKVELLTTQYRSIPDIGYVFSNFAYGGILQHYRSANSQRSLNVGDDLGVETLNIIKFPVSKYESIYRCKRLQHSSSYQVYSALFTYEYICYLSRAIADNNPGSLFKIGVIAPYRAQADMIDKLLASEQLPKEVDVQVGTIHGFQGDECDIIFAVFNTPPTISASKDMFLNKRNIINVSISRARDYLFIVMPDDDTENITNLRLVRRVEQLTHDTDAWNEFLSPDLEDLMFGDPKYLENNAFSTSHQSVNVYGLPEKCYEVRTEDTAVDVQIHKAVSVVMAESTATADMDQNPLLTERPSSVIESSSLDESRIPKELRKKAIDLPV